ncbi:MAG: hypothetical protein BWY22_02533 [Bacteroidetes bacterium ADurb.Bin217]|nr:MAG: hypothetical protein BWY22_02533 [Bacteroidetes bacterium ADurb.Bin217]
MNRNKNKGKTWERELATHLSKITGKSFIRVPNSGSYIGKSNIFRAETLSTEQIGMFEGDIITPKEWDHVRFECKFYKKISWNNLWQFDGDKELNEWIQQAEQGTRPYWFLCFKINNIGKFVVFPAHQSFYRFSSHLIYTPKSIKCTYTPCFIVSMDSFFENNINIIEELNK